MNPNFIPKPEEGKVVPLFLSLIISFLCYREKTFDDTFHPEGNLQGRSREEFKEKVSRPMIGNVQVHDFRLVSEIDENTFVYQGVANGKIVGPLKATVKDGKIFTVGLADKN